MLRCDKQTWTYKYTFQNISLENCISSFSLFQIKLYKSLSNSYPDYLVIFIREHNKMARVNYSGFHHLIITYKDQKIHQLLHKIISKLHRRNKRF